MSLQHQRFDDFHLHGASAPEWQQRYLQLTPGTMRSALAEAAGGPLHVFRKWMSERVVQQGRLPPGRLCFVLLGANAGGTPRMQGRELLPQHLFLLRGGEEFTLQRPRGMELLALTFDAERFRQLLDQRPWPAAARALLARPALMAPLPALQALRQGQRGLLAQPGGPHAPQALFEALSALFAGAAEARQGAGSAAAGYVVAECQRLVLGGGPEPLSVEALCRRLRTSRRSVQNSFRQVADTTPLHYLRALRLNGVRRHLMQTLPSELSVSEAAAHQGFEHLSHFSQRYRALFGELPSQTPRRGDGTQSAGRRASSSPLTAS
jgi:AraC-like DNA-binding protein